MAEMVVRVIDKANPPPRWRLDHPLKWRYHTKAGDLIDLLPDGWRWGLKESGNPKTGQAGHHFWRIFRLPGYSVERVRMMGLFDGEWLWGERIQSRVRYFDLSGLWMRKLILSGQVITLYGSDQTRFINLVRTREQNVPIMVA